MIDLDALEVRRRQRQRVLDTKQGQARADIMRGKELQEEVADLSEMVETLDRVTILLNSLGEDRQQKAQETIETLVTRGLQTIFDDSLSFHIVQTVRAKRAEVDFLIQSALDGRVVETPVLEARGGGVTATVGFLLRLVIMLLTKGPRSENILLLDETFAHVSDDYLQALGGFIREVVDKTNIQVVMVTHQPEFAEFADRVYRFTTEDGKTVVHENG